MKIYKLKNKGIRNIIITILTTMIMLVNLVLISSAFGNDVPLKLLDQLLFSNNIYNKNIENTKADEEIEDVFEISNEAPEQLLEATNEDNSIIESEELPSNEITTYATQNYILRGNTVNNVTSSSDNIRNIMIEIGQSLYLKVYRNSTEVSSSGWTKWVSSNKDVADFTTAGVSKGVLVGKSVGYTTIYINDSNGQRLQAIVYVKNKNAVTVPQVINSGTNQTKFLGNAFRQTYVLKEDGTVWGVGSNNYGQLGDGTTNDSLVPVQMKKSSNEYLTDIVKIAGGWESLIALDKNKQVWVIGQNKYGSLCNGSFGGYSAYASKISGLTDIIDISGSGLEYTALTKNGNVYTWGRGMGYHLGNGSTGNKATLQSINISNVIKVSMCWSESALTERGEVYSWGDKEIGKELKVPTKRTTDVIDVAMLAHNACVLKTDKSVYGAGYNKYGELKAGTKGQVKDFIKITNIPNSSSVKYVSGNLSDIQLIMTDGSAWAIGYNIAGTLANGTIGGKQTSFVQMKDNNGIEINNALLPGNSANYWTDYNNWATYNSTLITKEGTVLIAGENSYGQMGNGTKTGNKEFKPYLCRFGEWDATMNYRNAYMPTNSTIEIKIEKYGFSVFNEFSGSYYNKNGWTWKSSNTQIATVNVNTGVIKSNKNGVEGFTVITGTSSDGYKAKIIVNVYRSGNVAIPQIYAGDNFTVILKADGTVWTCGNNDVGQLGVGHDGVISKPVQVKGLSNVKKISVYGRSVAALTHNGIVYVWGSNSYKQLGGTDEIITSASKIQGLTNDIIDVSLGEKFLLMLKKDGSVWACGNDANVLQGNSNVSNPIKLKDIKNIISISAGNNIAGAISQNCNTYIWGSCASGALGNGTLSSSATYMVGNDINKIEVGKDSSYLLKENKEVYSAGNNEYYKLGIGKATGKYSTHNLVVDSNGSPILAEDISAGTSNLMIKTSDKVYVTGNNANNQLSLGSSGTAKYARITKFSDNNNVTLVTSIGASSGNNLGIIKTDGSIWISGKNEHGQRGYNSDQEKLYYARIEYLSMDCRNEYISKDSTKALNVKRYLLNAYSTSDILDTTATFTYESSNTDIANVIDGVVIPNTLTTETGWTVIKVIDNDGNKAKVIINVYGKGDVTVPQVANGLYFTVVLKADGTVWTCGKNNYGQLGIGDSLTESLLPVQVKYNENTYLSDIANIKKIFVYSSTVVALATDGTVYGWGENASYQLEENKMYATKINGLSNIIDISVGNLSLLVLKDNGDIYGLGKLDGLCSIDYAKTPENLTKVTDAISISGGKSGVGAIMQNCDTYLWGNSNNGILGDGLNSSTKRKNYVGDDINKIYLITRESVLLKENGEVYAAGLNNYYELGIGEEKEKYYTYQPVKISSNQNIVAKDISGGGYNLMIKTDDKVYVTGRNLNNILSAGIIGNDKKDLSKYAIITKTSTEDFENAMFIGDGYTGNLGIIKTDGTVWISGLNSSGQVGNNTNITNPYFTQMGSVEVAYPEEIVITKGNTTEEPLSENNFKYTGFSFNVYSDVGEVNDSLTDKAEIFDKDIAIFQNDYIYGNKVGTTMLIAKEELSGSMIYIPVTVKKSDTDFTVADVQNGDKFTVALKADGTVWSFGNNTKGQLGTGNWDNKTAPVNVNKFNGKRIKEISVGLNHTIALAEDGSVYTWGLNSNGQLGTNDESFRTFYERI